MAEVSENSPLQSPPYISRTSGSWTKWLVYSTTVAVMGSSFQFGYNTGCINTSETTIRDYFLEDGKKMSEFKWSAVVSIFAIGGMFGALAGPMVANYFGRKSSLLLNNGIAIIGAILMILSYYTTLYSLLIIGRFIIGLNAGINTAVAPIYLSEIAPVGLRGSLGTLNQFGIVIGILVGYIFGLAEVLGNEKGWPWLLGFSAFPAVLQMMTLPCCPRSPRYLLLKRNEEAAAVKALQVLRGSTDVSEDIAEMRTEQERSLRERNIGVLALFTIKSLRMPLLIGVVMQMAQQLSGINAVMYYSTNLFETAKIKHSRFATLGVGGISVVMVAIVVRLVERLGRRTLMLWGLGGMFVFYGVMTLAFCLESIKGFQYVAIVSTLILVIFSNLALVGPIPWFITAEIFSQGPRPAACMIAAGVNWLSNFIVGVSFPSMKTALYPYTFLVFMVFLLGFWLFTFYLVPETKGRTIDEITSQFRGEAINYQPLDTDDNEIPQAES